VSFLEVVCTEDCVPGVRVQESPGIRMSALLRETVRLPLLSRVRDDVVGDDSLERVVGHHLVNTDHDLTPGGIGLKVLTGQGAAIDATTAAGNLVSAPSPLWPSASKS